MHTVATAPKSSEAKTCTKCKPLTFVHVDENDPQVEQCRSEREEGSKISRIHYVGSDRLALGSWRQKIQNQQRRPDARIWHALGKDMQISPRSCPPSSQLVLLKIYDLIFKFRNKSSILDLLFLTVPV